MAGRVRVGRKQGEGKAKRKGPTFRFTTRLPDGMTPEEARKRCLEALVNLAEGARP